MWRRPGAKHTNLRLLRDVFGKQRIRRHRYALVEWRPFGLPGFRLSAFKRRGWWLLFASLYGFESFRWVVQRHAPESIPQPMLTFPISAHSPSSNTACVSLIAPEAAWASVPAHRKKAAT